MTESTTPPAGDDPLAHRLMVVADEFSTLGDCAHDPTLTTTQCARVGRLLAEARQSLSEGISMPRWIVMSETEPEREGAYLIWDGEEYDIGTWRDGDFYRICGEDPPTHWMPLPEAPK